MWRLILALVPVIQPLVWLSMSTMSRWSPDRQASFRRLAAGYFILPTLVTTAWLLLGSGLDAAPRAGIAALILIVAYVICLVHAALVLFFGRPAALTAPAATEPKPRRGLLLDIAVIYCSVFWAVAFLGLAAWSLMTADAASLDPDDFKMPEWRGLWWIAYGILAAVLVTQLENHGVAARQVNLAILAAILAVPLVHYLCPWMRPWQPKSEQRLPRITPV